MVIQKRYILPFILLCIFVMTLTNLGGVFLFDVDEAVFSQASKEMLLSGDFINPTYNGINRYDKPILIYWLMSLSYSIFGINEFSARLPSAIAAVVLSLVLFLFMKKQVDEKSGIYAIITFSFSTYFFVYSRAAVTDMLLTLFITLALLSFYSNRGMKGIVCFHLFCALAFLTKGLVGVVFPYGVCIVYILVTRQWDRLRFLFNPIGILVFFVIAMPWYVAQYKRNGMEFIEQFFLKHHFQRYTDVISGHKGPFYYYFVCLLIGMLPWVVFLPVGIRHGLVDKKGLSGFALIWFVFVFVFFSLSTTKLPNYILPSIPAAVMLISISMKNYQGQMIRYILLSGAIISFVLFTFVFGKILHRYGIEETGWLYLIGLINLLSVVFLLIRIKDESFRYVGIAFCMFLVFMVISLKGLPLAAERLQGELHRYSMFAKQHLKPNERIIAYRINQPSIVFYSDRRVVSVGSSDDLINNTPHRLLITKFKYKDEVLNTGFRLLQLGRDYALFER
ncbi:MAG: glycosyltransferase family 39 protein [Thermodesulfovibrionales bacterium]|nr:glycosyltransferase family 39 protein [Thermodesulfovibrionales bacterium]